MAEAVWEWLYYICAMVCMVSVGEWTYHWTTRDIKRWLFAGGIYVFGFVLCIVLFPNIFFSSNIFYAIEILAWAIICEAGFKDKIGKIVAISLGVGIVEAIVSVFIDILLGQMIGLAGAKVLRIIFAFLFLYGLKRQKWYCRIVRYVENLSKWKKALVFIVVILGTVVAAYGQAVNIMLNNREATVFFKVLITINLVTVMLIVIWFIIENHQKKYYVEQNHLKEEYIRMQQDYYRTIYDKDREMRCFRHDVASQIGMLQLLLERNEVDGAREQLNRIYQDFSRATFRKIQVGDEMLDAVLSMMHQRALEKGINLDVMGEVQGKRECDVYELCTIFSNAISNAIEACQKLEGEKVVSVKINEHNRTLCCIFENAATEDMYQAVLNDVTTKEDRDNHGYGIHNIRRAVKRLNGSMEYRYKDGKLELEIYI